MRMDHIQENDDIRGTLSDLSFPRLMILESARWNEASAVEILLGMSDPNYKPEPAASAAPAAPAAPTMVCALLGNDGFTLLRFTTFHCTYV